MYQHVGNSSRSCVRGGGLSVRTETEKRGSTRDRQKEKFSDDVPGFPAARRQRLQIA